MSSVEATQACLDRIAAVDGEVHAFLHVDAAGAMAAAAASDARAVSRGPLDGMPIGIKDLIHVEGLPTTAGSRPIRWRSTGSMVRARSTGKACLMCREKVRSIRDIRRFPAPSACV